MYVTRQGKPTAVAIMDAVVEHYEVTHDDLRSGIRDNRHATARSVACYLLRQKGFSLSDVGRIVGRHHTSVMSAVERTQRALETVEGFRADVEAVKNKAAQRAAQSVSGGAQ